MGEPELDFDAIDNMEVEELKKLLVGHPERIEKLAQQILRERSNPFLPYLTNKVIRCLTREEDFHLPKVEALFKVLQLNHFLGLDPDQLLSNAIGEENAALASHLIDSGARFKDDLSEKQICEAIGTVCFLPFRNLYYQLLDWLEKNHPSQLSFQNPLFAPIYRKFLRDPTLSNCVFIVSDAAGKKEEISCNREILGLESRAFRELFRNESEKQTHEITVENIPSFHRFLRVLSGDKITWGQEILQELLIYADQFRCCSLQRICEEELSNEKKLEAENLFSLFSLAEKSHSSLLKNRLIYFAVIFLCKTEIPENERAIATSFLEQYGKELHEIDLRKFTSKIPLTQFLEKLVTYCPHIEKCALSPKMDEKDLWHLSRLDHLSHLDLSDFWATPKVFSLLSSLSGITSLDFCHQTLSEQIAQIITAWKGLKILNLAGSTFEMHSLETISRCTNLEKLILIDTHDLSLSQLRQLAKSLPQTEILT